MKKVVTESFGHALRGYSKREFKQRVHQRHRRRVNQELEEMRKKINSGMDPDKLDLINQPKNREEMLTYVDSPFF